MKKKALSFCLSDQNGIKRCLKDFLEELPKNGFLVLFFYPKDNTPGCTMEAVSFSENKSKFSRRGLKIVGVSKLNVESKKKFSDKHNLKITLLADEDLKVSKKYEVWKEKNMYGKKVWGINRETFLIDKKGRITHHFEKVKVKEHIDEIFEKVKELRNV